MQEINGLTSKIRPENVSIMNTIIFDFLKAYTNIFFYNNDFTKFICDLKQIFYLF